MFEDTVRRRQTWLLRPLALLSFVAAGLATVPAAALGARPSRLPVLIDWRTERAAETGVLAVREDGRGARIGLPCGGRAWRPSRRGPGGGRFSCVFAVDSRRPDRFRVAIASVAGRSRRTIYRTRAEPDQVFGDVHFSHDGRTVAFGTFRRSRFTNEARGHDWVVVVPAAGGAPRFLGKTPECRGGTPFCLQTEVLGFAAGDRKVVYTRRDYTGAREVRIVDLRRGTDRRLADVVPDFGALPMVAGLSPDGRLLALRTSRKSIRVLDVEKRRWRATQESAIPPQWFPDSRRLVVRTGGRTWAYDVETRRRRPLPDDLVGAAFSPDGKRYALGPSEGREVIVHALGGRRLQQLTRGAESVEWVAWGTIGIARPPPYASPAPAGGGGPGAFDRLLSGLQTVQ